MKIHAIPPRAMDANIYLIEDRNFVLVDTGTGAFSQRQVEDIRTIIKVPGRGQEPQKLTAIILTHYHHDHSGGAAAMQAAFGCPLFVHEAELEAIRKGDPKETGASMFFSQQTPVPAAQALDLGRPLETGTAAFRILETPGHSKGSICLYEPGSKSLISGDTVFPGGGVGRWDLAGGNRKELEASIGMLTKLDVSDIYSGHGPVVRGDGNKSIKASFGNFSFF